MSHKRTDIRNALKAMLLGTAPSYATDAGKNVFTNRADSIQDSQLPAINIYDESESATPLNLRATQSRRKLIMKIDARVKGATSYDSTLDGLVLQIENIIMADITLQGTASGIVYQGTEFSFEPGDQVISRATLSYEISYIL